MSDTLIDIQMQVMWNRLVSVVEEQALTLIRTAFSTSVREAGDLSAGVFDRAGNMLAQAVTGTPGHVNTMAEAVVHFINDIGEDNIFEGDVYVTNDPWKGTGHLHDITIVSPSFYKGRLIGYFASTAHVVDIGGRGFGPDAREVYEEGLFIPIMKLFERGKVNRDLINILRNNVRENDRVVGDFYALSACNETGHKRLLDMLEEFKLDDLEHIGGFILEHSRRATLECFKSLPHGTYTNSMTLDGYDVPVTLVVTLTVGSDGIKSDFTGTSGMSQFGINVPLATPRPMLAMASNASSRRKSRTTLHRWRRSRSLRRKAASSTPSTRRRCRCAMCWAISCPTWCLAHCTSACPAKCRPRAPVPCGTCT